MKQCPQCLQIYNDDTNFCLTDGATLAPVSGSYVSQSDMPTISQSETPTVLREIPAPTVYSQAQTQQSYSQGQQPPPSFSGAPFVPPVVSEPAEKTNTLLIAALVGLLALIVGGAIVGAVIYGVFKTDDKNTNAAVNSNSADKTNKSPSPEKTTDETDERADKLKQDQEKLERDRQKLEEERKRLEEQKKKPQQTPPPRSGTTAVIIDPPSNIRSYPNGPVICVARTRGTIVNILGSTGVYDNNGVWYYTDYCGRQGVIHSSQIRF